MNVLYVLKRYPRLSETFIVREIVELEHRGVVVGIDALLPPEAGPRHPMVNHVRARVRYLPRRPHLIDAQALRAHLVVGLRRPVSWVREARRARRDDTWRRFVQAGIVARRVRREDVGVIHAHFATLTATCSDAFWTNISFARIMALQETFAPLMRFRNRRPPGTMVRLSLPDAIQRLSLIHI